VSTSGGVFPQWSPDGKELFYISPDTTLMAVPIKSVGASLELQQDTFKPLLA
jgi:hypothetical protein